MFLQLWINSYMASLYHLLWLLWNSQWKMIGIILPNAESCLFMKEVGLRKLLSIQPQRCSLSHSFSCTPLPFSDSAWGSKEWFLCNIVNFWLSKPKIYSGRSNGPSYFPPSWRGNQEEMILPGYCSFFTQGAIKEAVVASEEAWDLVFTFHCCKVHSQWLSQDAQSVTDSWSSSWSLEAQGLIWLWLCIYFAKIMSRGQVLGK